MEYFVARVRAKFLIKNIRVSLWGIQYHEKCKWIISLPNKIPENNEFIHNFQIYDFTKMVNVTSLDMNFMFINFAFSRRRKFYIVFFFKIENLPQAQPKLKFTSYLFMIFFLCVYYSFLVYWHIKRKKLYFLSNTCTSNYNILRYI